MKDTCIYKGISANQVVTTLCRIGALCHRDELEVTVSLKTAAHIPFRTKIRFTPRTTCLYHKSKKAKSTYTRATKLPFDYTPHTETLSSLGDHITIKKVSVYTRGGYTFCLHTYPTGQMTLQVSCKNGENPKRAVTFFGWGKQSCIAKKHYDTTQLSNEFSSPFLGRLLSVIRCL